jgi:hypothetical protein
MKWIVAILNNTIVAVASIRAGFIFALMGTLTQTAHTWFIALQFSSFTGSMAAVQAALLSMFLSGGLLFFTVRTGSAKTFTEKSKYNKIANAFMALEIFINLFYWTQKIVFIPWLVEGNIEQVQWFKLIIAVPFAILIPVILKTYGGEINLDDIEVDKVPADQQEMEKLQSKLVKLEDQLQSFRSKEQVMKITNMNHDNKEYTVTFK